MVQAVQQTWEYQVEIIENVRAFQERLSQLGREGWELVSVVGGSGGERSGPAKTLRAKRDEAYCLILKRPADA